MVRFHGNWVGPGWTAGQDKSTGFLTEEDRKVPAIDAFDQAAKDHDISLFDHPEDASRINKRFVREARKHGLKASFAALLVGLGGPSAEAAIKEKRDAGESFPNLRWERLRGFRTVRSRRERGED